MHNSRVPALDPEEHPRKQPAAGRGPVGRLRNQLSCLGPSFPVGRWESNPRQPRGVEGGVVTGGWWGKQTTSGAQQALAQCSQRDPEPHQSHAGCATGQQSWEPQGLCSLGPYTVTSEPEYLSPKWRTGLTELSCHSLQSQPQLGGRGALPSSIRHPSCSTPVLPDSQWDPNGAPTICRPLHPCFFSTPGGTVQGCVTLGKSQALRACVPSGACRH